jgi:arsenate reductase
LLLENLNITISGNRKAGDMSGLKYKVLFVCIHNSARSQMAEAFLNAYGGDKFEAESAGLEPGKMNPTVVKVMQESGIDLSQKGTQGVFDVFKKGTLYSAVITVCDEASAEQCPIFPGMVKRIAWSFTDPSTFKGSPDDILEKTRRVRNEIESAVKDFIREAGNVSYWLN